MQASRRPCTFFLLLYAITLTCITCSFENDPPESQSKPFSTHLNKAKNWARGGADFLADYLTHRGMLYSVQINPTYTTQTESDESGVSSEEDKIIPEVPVDRSGNPRLPSQLGLKLKTQQLLVREIFKK